MCDKCPYLKIFWPIFFHICICMYVYIYTFCQSSVPSALSTLVTSVFLYSLTRTTLESWEGRSTCLWIFICIYIFIYIYTILYYTILYYTIVYQSAVQALDWLFSLDKSYIVVVESSITLSLCDSIKICTTYSFYVEGG